MWYKHQLLYYIQRTYTSAFAQKVKLEAFYKCTLTYANAYKCIDAHMLTHTSVLMHICSCMQVQ